MEVKMNYGIIYDEDINDYHATPAVSNSKLKDFSKRPSLYKKKYIDKDVERKESKAFAIGSGLHAAVLEGITAFNKNFCVLPDGFDLKSNWSKKVIGYINGETCLITEPNIKKTLKKAKVIKELVEQYTEYDIIFGDDAEKYTQAVKEIGGEKAIGKTPLAHKDFHEVLAMIKSVHAHPIAQWLLKTGKPEVTVRRKLKNFDVQCRFDWLCEYAVGFDGDPLMPQEGEAYACDLKSCQSLDDWVSGGFNNVIRKFGYDDQEAFYRMVSKEVSIKHFFFIAVEKQEPMECAVFVIDAATLNASIIRVSDNLKRIDKCYSSGIWPGFKQEVIITEVAEVVRDRLDTESEQRRQISE
jgi:hypothetical protein